ncbi:MAG TPA: hypothetical protein V6D35_09420 [Candidatus Sericytochromatia bacterium]
MTMLAQDKCDRLHPLSSPSWVNPASFRETTEMVIENLVGVGRFDLTMHQSNQRTLPFTVNL